MDVHVCKETYHNSGTQQLTCFIYASFGTAQHFKGEGDRRAKVRLSSILQILAFYTCPFVFQKEV